MFPAADILVNIKLCIIYRILKAGTLTLNKPLFLNIQALVINRKVKGRALLRRKLNTAVDF